MRSSITVIIGITLLILALAIQQTYGCSTFCLKDNGHIVFGRSYDWTIGYGYIMINHRNVQKTRYLPYDEIPASWISKYGSITFNQYGREYPIGGMNEVGLVVEVMMLDDTQYQDKDERVAVDELGWVQYQLDNSASIGDVIESNKKIRISNQTFAKLHFLISDSSGNTLAVEYINGEFKNYSGESLPYRCLTNDTYLSSLNYLKKHEGYGGDTPVNYQNHRIGNSLERFVIVADMLNKYNSDSKGSIIDYSFDILNRVKDDDYTQFQIVYDIKEKNVYFRSMQSPSIKSVSIHDFNYDCTSEIMMIDINATYEGSIGDKFIPYDSVKNRELVLRAYSDSWIELPGSILDKITGWSEDVRCIPNE